MDEDRGGEDRGERARPRQGTAMAKAPRGGAFVRFEAVGRSIGTAESAPAICARRERGASFGRHACALAPIPSSVL